MSELLLPKMPTLEEDDEEAILLLLAAMDMDAGTIKVTVQFEAPKPKVEPQP